MKTGATEIPLVDMRLKKKDPVAFAMAVGTALHDFGFFRLVGHGVSEKTIKDADMAARRFWALPLEVKDRYSTGNYAAASGSGVCYVRNGEYALSSDKVDIKEELGINGAVKTPALTAREMLDAIKEVPDLGEKTMRVYDRFSGIAKSIMGSIAVYSGEQESYFAEWFKEPTAYMRHLHYPHKGNAAGHLDFSMLTVLHVSEEGLYVRNRHGENFQVAPRKGELIINGGMQLDLITNLHIRSSWHGVEANVPRTSMPLFLHPMDHIALEPLPRYRANAPKQVPSYFPPRDENGFYSILTKDFNDIRRREIYEKQDKVRHSLKGQLAL